MQQLINQISNANNLFNKCGSSILGFIFIFIGLMSIIFWIIVTKQGFAYRFDRIFASFVVLCLSSFFFINGIIQIKDDKDYSSLSEKEISKANQEEKQVVSVQSTKHPYSVVISGTQGTDNVTILTFFNQKQDAINFIKSNASARQVYLSNYLILNTSNNKPLTEGTETMLKVSIDKMDIKSTKTALPNVIEQSKEWKDE